MFSVGIHPTSAAVAADIDSRHLNRHRSSALIWSDRMEMVSEASVGYLRTTVSNSLLLVGILQFLNELVSDSDLRSWNDKATVHLDK